MRFEKVPIKFLRKTPQKYVFVNDGKETNKLDKYLSRLAHFSQILLVVLGTAGYFYTIKPAFQQQLLQENAAKLEIENRAAQKQLSTLLQQQSGAEEKLGVIRVKLKEEQARSDVLTKTMSELKKSKIDTDIQAKQAKETLSQLEDAIKWKTILSNFKKNYDEALHKCCAYPRPGDKTFNETNTYDGLNKPGDIILEWGNFWPKPYKLLLDAVELISAENKLQRKYADSYYNEIKTYIASWESDLKCEKPDFNKLHSEFIVELKTKEPAIVSESNTYNNQLLDKQSPGYMSLIKKQLLEHKSFDLEWSYYIKVGALKNDCDKKVDVFFEELMSKRNKIG